MFDEISKSFQKVYDAIDEWVEEVREILKQEAHQVLRQTIYEASKFKEELAKKKVKAMNTDLRSECITFLRDYGVKESYKGTEYLIYTLLAHRSSDNIKLGDLFKEISDVYGINVNTVRASFVSAVKSVDEEYMTAKESLYTIMRDWEIYKQDKELE